jgi:hypothetical protein
MISLDCFVPPSRMSSPTSPAPARLKIAVIHDDARAAARAKTMLSELEKSGTNTLSMGATLWRFELLECVAWRCRAATEIAKADVLIVALSRPDAVPSDINRWLETSFDQLQRRKAFVVGLFGDDFSWALGPKADAVAPADVIGALLDSQLAAA